ncbi:unnamed protein product [Caenorhabditis sp. 36 PRJEB53466]|nr:unnamed protein product [Caenorhabditis sp. 36 PRJEB53466]
MPPYKLTYFNLRGWAEPARQLFKLAHVSFEDVRVENGTPEWEALKPKTPFGQLPVLSVDGFEIPQSAAILRYLANKFGYAGKSAEEQAWADAIVDQFKDFVGPLRQLIMAQRAGEPQEIERVKKEIFAPARDVLFTALNGILAKSKSGWLVGDGITWADLVIADILYTMEKLGVFDGSAAENRKLTAFREKVNEVPEIKQHNENRPDSVRHKRRRHVAVWYKSRRRSVSAVEKKKKKMPEYKLYYFQGRGLGDVSRQLFALSGTPFEDIRVEQSEWQAGDWKSKMPFGQMPVLELPSGRKIPQSLAVARFLAKKFGYAGKTDEEAALADALADQFKDFYAEIRPYYYGRLGLVAADVEAAKTNCLIPARDKFLPILVKFLKESNSGFLLSGGLTYADLIISDNMRTLLGWWPEYLQPYPEVQAWFKKIDSIPEIKKHLASHPDLGF